VPLQPLIDRAPDGSEVMVPAGNYHGPVVIGRRLTVRADGQATIAGTDGDRPVVTLRDGSAISGFTVRDEQFSANHAAIAVEGSGNRVENNTIESYMHGVMLRGADGNVICGNRIIGLFNEYTESEIMVRGNGVDMRDGSDGNQVADNTISDKQDGSYAEKSVGNVMEGNTVTGSRYALHVMFTERSILRGNTGQDNVTGAIVMTTVGTQVLDNLFTRQNDNVNSSGVLIYDVKEGVVRGNVIEGNRTGLQLDDTNGAVIENNRLSANFVGMTVTDANNNVLRGNQFIGNVVDVQAADGLKNEVSGNFWDQFHGIDPEGGGTSGIPYRVNPFFLKLTGIYPAFQLFFDAPGMTFLDKMFQSGSERWLTDTAPLMHPQASAGETQVDGGTGVLAELLLGLLLIGLSGTIIFRLGVAKR
jgi:nitrous oxidase accessory protein